MLPTGAAFGRLYIPDFAVYILLASLLQLVSGISYELVCAFSEDSNKSAHPYSLIRALVFHLKKY